MRRRPNHPQGCRCCAWCANVTDAWRSADHAWWLAREAEAVGYETEQREFAARHPRPRLGDFMVALSYGVPA